MRLLYLTLMASLKDESDISMFRDAGYEVFVLNADKSRNFNELSGLPGFKEIINLYEIRKGRFSNLKVNTKRLLKKTLKPLMLDKCCFLMKLRERIMKKQLLKNDNKLMKMLADILKQYKIEVVYSSWSITCFKEIKAIQGCGVKVPIILNIETYPFFIINTVGQTYKEDQIFKNIIEKLDGRIHCTEVMYSYFNRQFNLKDHGKDLKAISYFRQNYHCGIERTPLSRKDKEPHIVFIGTTGFSERTIDDVSRQIYQIADKGIHVHIGKPDINMKKHPYLHIFPLFNKMDIVNGNFAAFMTQFDACAVLYNINKKYSRFNNSVPMRFLFAICAEIPIVLPRGYFGSCEEIINKYKIGFSYANPDELKMKISNKNFMFECKNSIKKIAPLLTFENQFSVFDAFIKAVVKEKAKE
ncbi:MAG: hypothetical protein KAJ66_03175 [Candidatus Omnitrophica bacterium]|nr:hypothetical protein [Candidatus Omnitrophota bacterium]